MVTGRRFRQEQLGERWRTAGYPIGLLVCPQIRDYRFCQGQSRVSGAKHPLQNWKALIASRKQYDIFLATSVTKMLDHNSPLLSSY